MSAFQLNKRPVKAGSKEREKEETEGVVKKTRVRNFH